MTYLPSEVLNSNYHYYSNGTYYTIRTNLNCYQQYNSTYCDCFNIYPEQDYLKSKTYACTGSNISEIDFSNFTDTLSYRLDIDKIFLIGFIILFGMIFLLKCLCSMLFKGVFN